MAPAPPSSARHLQAASTAAAATVAAAPLAARAGRARAPRATLAAGTLRVVRVALVVLLVAGGPGRAPLRAQAVDTSNRQALESDVQRYQDLLAARRQEIDDIEAALGSTATELKAKIAERDKVARELDDLRAQERELEGQLAELQDQRTATEARIDALDGRLEDLKVRIRALLLNLYEQHGTRFAGALSRSTSFHEFQLNQYFLSLLARQDVAVVNDLSDLLGQLKEEQARLAQELAAVQAKQQEIDANAAAREATRKQLEGVIADLQATQKGQLAQKQSLLSEQDKLETSLGNVRQQLQDEIARLKRVEEQARADAARYAEDREKQLALQRQADQARSRLDALTAPATPLATGFVMPLDHGKIVSRFGESNNSFVAIEAPVDNAAVRAAQDGKVVAISYLGANFGYMVAVQHGGGLTTVYANLRQPVVSLFDPVAQGDVLGYLGGGTLTHSDVLPFYARSDNGSGNGVFVDPAPLLGR